MKPVKFQTYIEKFGTREKYSANKIFHTQDFDKRVFLLEKGFVKRYQARKIEQKVLELLYGPGHIISLSQLYKMLFDVDQNQNAFLYVYQTLTDVEMLSIDANDVINELQRDPEMYRDFFYESGLKLRSNILRLASNSIKDNDKKVAHQLTGLALEFGVASPGSGATKLPFPHTTKDLAEQLNIPDQAAQTALDDLVRKNIISINGTMITILDMRYLQDIYL